MVNPILQKMNINNIQQIKQMMNMFKGANNPQQLLQNMAMNNPQLKMVLNYINQNGGNPKDAFYKMAQEKGIDPEEIIKMLK